MDEFRDKYFSSPKQTTGVLVFIFLILVLAGATTYILTSRNDQNKESSSQTTTPPSSLSSSQLLVYGYWEPGKSHINAFVINTQKTYTLATLPENVKHVSVLSSGQLLYVGNTDKRDYGSEIDKYSLIDKKTAIVLKADPGFGIDDYVISSNGQYIAEYEIQFAPGSSIVYGGNERVYSFDLLHRTSKQLIYSEVINHSIPYPIGITNEGRIFFDTWLPNSGEGWAYGMIVSDFSGTNKQNIPSMTNGTYGRTPVLSPDGKQFAFAGYDGNQGDGTQMDSAGIRRAIDTPDTIELLDTTTLQRTKLPNLSNSNQYDDVKYDSNTGNLIINQITANLSTSNVSFYDLTTHAVIKIPTTNQDAIASLAPNTFLLATSNTSQQTMGNLGNSYQFPYINFSTIDLTKNTTAQLSVPGSFMQFIAFFPPNSILQSTLEQIGTITNQTLQLATFEIKPSLAPERETQQNDPPKSIVPLVPIERAPRGRGIITKNADCKPAIYLYPPKRENVSVKISINGNMEYTDPPYPTDGWYVTADPNGALTYQNQAYEYLFYEAQIPDKFFSDARVQNTGYVVASADLQQFFSDVLPKLGLNGKETHEFTNYWLKALPNAPYYKVSLLPQSLIDSFAPLTVDPIPATVLRVTLYFQLLDHFVPVNPPQLPAVHRRGFTVIEWGGVVKSDPNHPFTCLM